MRRTQIVTLFLAGLAIACSTSQVTRTGQNRPTTPPAPTVRTTGQAGVIPSGTEFSVRANETIDTKQAGGTYRAEVAQTIEDANGRVLVPSGAPAELTVVQARSGGEVGSRGIELAIRSVTVDGKRHMISTETRTEEGPAGLGTNRRTAEMVGGGAAIGALIGAIAGGGSGAAAGAAIGAAGGAATQVLTRGDTVRIPAETVMSFRTNQDWQLQ